MNLQTALDRLQQSNDIDHWNDIRDQIKAEVLRENGVDGQRVWLKEYMPTIDGTGLVVQVLGPDKKLY